MRLLNRSRANGGGGAGGDSEIQEAAAASSKDVMASSTTKQQQRSGFFRRNKQKQQQQQQQPAEVQEGIKIPPQPVAEQDESRNEESASIGSFFRRRNKNRDGADSEGGEQREDASGVHSVGSGIGRMFQKKGEKKNFRVFYSNFGADASQIMTVKEDEGIPTVEGADHVLMKVQASTVTINDCLVRRGFDSNVFSPMSLPITPGMDAVGLIVETGSNVTEYKPGDRVAALVRSGGNSRFLSVPASSLVKMPSTGDTAELAALVSIYTTAQLAMRKITRDSPTTYSLKGKKILVLGGLDGVGQALQQLCKKAQATVYAVAPKNRHKYYKSVLGVNPLPEKGWLSIVQGQVDYIFDGVCENGSKEPFKALKKDGEIVCYGDSSLLQEKEMGMFGAPISAHLNKFYSKLSTKTHTIDIWESFCSDPETYKKDLQALAQQLKWHKLAPHIAKRVSLTEVAAAQAKLEKGEIRGTTVCFPWRNLKEKRSAKKETGEEDAGNK